MQKRLFAGKGGRVVPRPIRLNWYVYCGNDPVNFVDWLGLCKENDEIKWHDGMFDASIEAFTEIGDAFKNEGVLEGLDTFWYHSGIGYTPGEILDNVAGAIGPTTNWAAAYNQAYASGVGVKTYAVAAKYSVTNWAYGTAGPAIVKGFDWLSKKGEQAKSAVNDLINKGKDGTIPYAKSLGAAGSKDYNKLVKAGNKAVGSTGRKAATQLKSLAEKAGLKVVPGGSHLKVKNSAGGLVTTIPHSPHGSETVKKIVKEIINGREL